MSKQKIWMDKKKKRWVGVGLTCDCCNESIGEVAILFECYAKKGSKIKPNFVFVDHKHLDEVGGLLNKPLYDVISQKMVLVVDKIPVDSFIYSYPAPVLSNHKSGCTVFEAGVLDLGSESVVNKCVVARAGVGCRSSVKMLEDQEGDD